MEQHKGNNTRSYRLIASGAKQRSLIVVDAVDDNDAIDAGERLARFMMSRANETGDRLLWSQGSVTLVDWQGNFVANMREVIRETYEQGDNT
jgi:hypothetical protein